MEKLPLLKLLLVWLLSLRGSWDYDATRQDIGDALLPLQIAQGQGKPRDTFCFLHPPSCNFIAKYRQLAREPASPLGDTDQGVKEWV